MEPVPSEGIPTIGAGSLPRSRRGGLFAIALTVIVGIAAVNVLWGLASGSLFIDEHDAWRHATGPLGYLLTSVRLREVSPPAYFAGLGVWTRLFGDSLFALRLPSALAVVATVAAVAWLALEVAGHGAAILAALLAAVAPVFLDYGQQARPYAVAALLSTVAAASLLSYSRSSRQSVIWLVMATAAAVLAVWASYTCWLVIAPLAGWFLTRTEVRTPLRAGFACVLVAAFAAFSWLLYDQIAYGGHQGAIIRPAGLESIARVVGTPYDRLYNVFHLRGQITGAAVVILGLAVICILANGLPRDRRVLLMALSLTPPAVMIAIAGLAQNGIFLDQTSELVISRYTMVAAPFMVAAIGIAIVRSPRLVGGALGVLALGLAVSGTVQSHERRARFPDTGGAMRFVGQHWRPGDLLAPQGYAAVGNNLEYYVHHLLPGGDFAKATHAAGSGGTIRVWSVGEANESTPSVMSSALLLGFHLVDLRDFTAGAIPIRVTLLISLPPVTAGKRATAVKAATDFLIATANRQVQLACALLTPQGRARLGHTVQPNHSYNTCPAAIAAVGQALALSGGAQVERLARVRLVRIDGDRAVVLLTLGSRMIQVQLQQVGIRWLVDGAS